MRNLNVAALAALLALSACGGGGGGGRAAVAPDPQTPVDAPGEALVRTTSQWPTAERVADYLYSHASGGPWDGSYGAFTAPPGIARFASPPTVRMTGDMTGRERAIAHYGVALVNRALPYEHHLQIGPDGPSVSVNYGDELQGQLPDGQISIEFHRDDRRDGAVAHLDVTSAYDEQEQRWKKQFLRASQVEMNGDWFDQREDWLTVSTLVHEFLHTLGLPGHPDHDEYPDSNMADAWFRLDGSLPAIDAAAVLAFYTRLPTVVEPEDLSAASLGPWDEQSTDLTRRVSRVSFGVRHANGVAMPWTTGTEPARALADNIRLQGTATWNGGLIGLTPALVGVQGDAEISVSLATMDGRADFTALEHEDGSTWGDGDLGYTIAVGANYLRSTGGDAGTVNGQFYGANHEGVGGSVERADLTGAFGAVRR